MTSSDAAADSATDVRSRWWSNPVARKWVGPKVDARATVFHERLDGYVPTPLVDLPALADELGVGRVLVKDESSRLGLPAFKVLGVSWAVQRALTERLGLPVAGTTIAELRSALPEADPVILVTATDGNHGRALARMARLTGLPAHVVVPQGLPPTVIQAISDESAKVTAIAGDYDASVRHAARLAESLPGGLLIQDTAWPGYQRIPQWIVDGYATMFREIDGQLAATGLPPADLVAVPVGVGSLAQAAVAHCRRGPGGSATAVLSVEPDTAACVLASLRAGQAVSVTTGATIMNGLNCGSPSSLAWPMLRDGLDAAASVPDRAAIRAMVDLAAHGVASGPSGAAALAGVRAVVTGLGATDRRAALGLSEDSTVVLLSTEGPIPMPGD